MTIALTTTIAFDTDAFGVGWPMPNEMEPHPMMVIAPLSGSPKRTNVVRRARFESVERQIVANILN